MNTIKPATIQIDPLLISRQSLAGLIAVLTIQANNERSKSNALGARHLKTAARRMYTDLCFRMAEIEAIAMVSEAGADIAVLVDAAWDSFNS